MYLITPQYRAHNTQKAWKLRCEPGSLICAEWGMPLRVCPGMMQIGRQRKQHLALTRAFTMPVMKLILWRQAIGRLLQ
jgi:hypothetical protein